MKETNTKLVFVGGKGGVGKTTVACALALSYSKNNKKTLLVELESPSTVSQYISISHNLEHLVLNPETSLKEYVLRVVKLGLIYHVVFENRFFKIFLNATPGLKELILLGHLWYLVNENDFDTLIVDLPASGHAHSFLNVPRIVKKFIKTGPLSHITTKVEEMLEHSKLYFVTIPQSLAVTETLEFIEKAEKSHLSPPSLIYLNRYLAWPVPPVIQSASKMHEESIFSDFKVQLKNLGIQSNIENVLGLIKNQCKQSVEYEQILKKQSLSPVRTLPFIFSRNWGSSEIEHIVTCL
ncbi:MAG: AAA family ATPase [Deltaproteobacteria bacterium]|nr:AAA family ATPase [Deltaproteobacteria bacterium]